MTSISSNTTLPLSSDTTYDNLFPNLSNAIIPKNSLFDDIKKSKCIQTIINEISKMISNNSTKLRKEMPKKRPKMPPMFDMKSNVCVFGSWLIRVYLRSR